jgi:hypothetical protein
MIMQNCLQLAHQRPLSPAHPGSRATTNIPAAMKVSFCAL